MTMPIEWTEQLPAKRRLIVDDDPDQHLVDSIAQRAATVEDLRAALDALTQEQRGALGWVPKDELRSSDYVEEVEALARRQGDRVAELETALEGCDEARAEIEGARKGLGESMCQRARAWSAVWSVMPESVRNTGEGSAKERALDHIRGLEFRDNMLSRIETLMGSDDEDGCLAEWDGEEDLHDCIADVLRACKTREDTLSARIAELDSCDNCEYYKTFDCHHHPDLPTDVCSGYEHTPPTPPDSGNGQLWQPPQFARRAAERNKPSEAVEDLSSNGQHLTPADCPPERVLCEPTPCADGDARWLGGAWVHHHDPHNVDALTYIRSDVADITKREAYGRGHLDGLAEGRRIYAERARTYAENLRPGEDPRPHKLHEYVSRPLKGAS